MVRKLALVQDYNRFKGGVDRDDEMLSLYTSVRKSYKLYKMLAGHVMEECLLTAYMIQKKKWRHPFPLRLHPRRILNAH